MNAEVLQWIKDLKTFGYIELRGSKHLRYGRHGDVITLPQGSKISPHWRNETLMRLKRLRAEYESTLGGEREARRKEIEMENEKVLTQQPQRFYADKPVPVMDEKTPRFKPGMTSQQINDELMRLREADVKAGVMCKAINASGLRMANGKEFKTTSIHMRIHNERARRLKDDGHEEAAPAPRSPVAGKVLAAHEERKPEIKKTADKSERETILKLIADLALSNAEEETRAQMVVFMAKKLEQLL